LTNSGRPNNKKISWLGRSLFTAPLNQLPWRRVGWNLRILIIEDEPKVARSLVQGFEAEHFAVDLAEDGEKGLHLATDINYDGIVLDWNLPRLDGLSLLRKLRQTGSSTRVLILSGRREVSDRVAGLQAGADDYLIKPFSFQELLVRMHTLLRRAQEKSEVLTVADLSLDPQRHTVERAGKPIKLSQREYALLEYLMRNAGRTVTRTMVVEQVWNLWFEGLTSVVDVYISYVRAKVDHGFSKPLIHTIRGVGFMLSADPKADKTEKAEKADKTEKPDRPDKPDKTEKTEN
jgi:DNA-binding response OmpR family regulator